MKVSLRNHKLHLSLHHAPPGSPAILFFLSVVKDVSELLPSSLDADSSLPTINVVRGRAGRCYRKSTSNREVKCGMT